VKDELKEKVLHQRVWHSKNGPHDKWSWEIHVDTPRALGGAVAFLMLHNNATDGNEKKLEKREEAHKGSAAVSPPLQLQPLYFPFHCRTYDGDNEKNEYDDHAFRLGWIGSPDPQPLDIDFFKRW
jgi:hypothetical protein